MYFFIYLAVYYLVSVKGSVNYCSHKICNNTHSHTFCKYAGPSSSCVGYEDVKLTTAEKLRLLARFNQRRSDTARGRLRSFPTAANMLEMRWVEELARSAQRWADQCRPPSSPEEKDTCRDLYSITVGQCVASIEGESPGLQAESLADMWYMQSLYYNKNITNYVISSSNQYYGDFAQMIWANTHLVGCGRSRFMVDISGRTRRVERLVCNFAPRGPRSEAALWKPGTPASSCPHHTQSQPNGLCLYRNETNIVEDYRSYKYNEETNKMSLKESIFLNSLNVIENNISLNYVGSLDEEYLKRLAIVTMNIGYADVITKKMEDILALKSTTAKTSLNNFRGYNRSGNGKHANEPYVKEDKENLNIIDMPDLRSIHDYKYNNDDNEDIRTVKEESSKYINDTNETINSNKINKIHIEKDRLTDYFQDSESPEDFEDVLNRLERALTNTVPTIGKVRRELRDLPVTQPNTPGYISFNLPSSSVTSQTVITNLTADRGPVMKMVMKYVPILQQYEASLKSNSKKHLRDAFLWYFVLCLAF